eukprot:15029364-Alexandrium_andersonii.AAC.1
MVACMQQGQIRPEIMQRSSTYLHHATTSEKDSRGCNKPDRICEATSSLQRPSSAANTIEQLTLDKKCPMGIPLYLHVAVPKRVRGAAMKPAKTER